MADGPLWEWQALASMCEAAYVNPELCMISPIKLSLSSEKEANSLQAGAPKVWTLIIFWLD